MSEDVRSRRLRVLKPGGGALKSLAWSPDGTRLAVGSDDNSVYVLTPEGRVLWEGKGHSNWVWSVGWSPDGRRLASGSNDTTVRVWDAATGDLLLSAEGHKARVCSVAWSPDGRRLASGSEDRTVRVLDAANGDLLLQCDGHKGTVRSVTWSPDGLRLASGSYDDTVSIWNASSGNLLLQYDGPGGDVDGVVWSPKGHRIATSSDDGTIRVLDAATGNLLQQCKSHKGWVYGVDWSPDGRQLASGSHDKTTRIWDAEDGRELAQIGTHTAIVWSVAFSPDGTRLASASNDETVALWDVSDLVTAVPRPTEQSAVASWLTRQAATVGRRASQVVQDDPRLPRPEGAETLPTDLAPLPAALAALHRLNLYPPLSLLRDLRDLLAGHPVDGDLRSLSSHPGLRRLTSLHWPSPARVGLAALLLRELRGDEWKPPPELAPADLRTSLSRALAGDPVPPDAPAPPVALLTRSAETIDERLVTLLAALGPDAVAADPGLPLRVLHQAPSLPRLSAPQRRLLGLRLAPSESGPAQGTGTGLDRTGIASTGTILSLVPSQLIQPWELLAWRHQNGGLLYRARTGREPPHFRPAVLVLDVSPACFGPVEGLTRPAAHALASTLRRLGLPVVLVAARGEGSVHLLDDPADLLEILTLRTLKSPDASRVMTTAERLRGRLRGGVTEPVVVLLTHPWWGAEASDVGASSHLRALFVQYPGREVRPRWADRCERWESLGAGQHADLPRVLGRLLG